jgi:chromosome segregation ATPase
MSSEFDIQLQNIQQKLQQVMRQYQHLQKENDQLKAELKHSQSLLAEKNKQLAELQQKADVLKLGVKEYSDQEKKDLEKRIDEYLKEIEKCLALLNA